MNFFSFEVTWGASRLGATTENLWRLNNSGNALAMFYSANNASAANCRPVRASRMIAPNPLGGAAASF